VHLYDTLFSIANPAEVEGDFKEYLNPNSLIVKDAYIEPALATANLQDRFQFLRLGYFCLDKTSTAEHLIFNRTVGLKDSWAKKG
jgi:glutaminyl-tRNA synthetase